MRELTKKQKNLLIKWYKEAEPSDRDKIVFNKVNPLRNVESLTSEQWEELENINNTEILYQNVNGFLWDLRMEVLK